MGTVRIIGGKFRGKKISFPDEQGLRPTPDRIRETLFNWLMHDVQGAHCLDAFAGSGALGLEAYSRGASSVVFLEKNRMIYQHLQKLIASFNQPQLLVQNLDTNDFFYNKLIKPFDIIFLDPPFSLSNFSPIIHAIEASKILIPGGLLYIESPTQLTPNPEVWELLRSNKAGKVFYALLKKL